MTNYSKRKKRGPESSSGIGGPSFVKKGTSPNFNIKGDIFNVGSEE